MITYAPDWTVTDRRLELYQKCPRRFFYTHVLGLGGARKTTAFSRTHDCLYELIRWLVEARLDGEPSDRRSGSRVRIDLAGARSQRTTPSPATTGGSPRAWSARWCDSGAGRRFQKSEPLAIDFPNGRVVVEPNETRRTARRHGRLAPRAHRLPDARRNMTGSNTHSIISPARRISGDGFVVEALHLTDEIMEAVDDQRPRSSATGATKTDEMLAGINAGAFPDRRSTPSPARAARISSSARPRRRDRLTLS